MKTGASRSAGPAAAHPVVFFDGECGLCHRGVRFLAARDPRARLRFAPLDGEFARETLPRALRDAGPDGTVVLLEPDGTVSVRAAAVLRALAATGGPWRAAGAISRVPAATAVLDVAYRAVARRRDRWFGRTTECPLPDPAMRARLLP
ncbi:MAG: thiol-disulfide oxidoreductase DCC family protein [Alphaproteobacteria bacterium]